MVCMPLWLQCPIHNGSSVEFIELPACLPTYQEEGQVAGPWEPFGRVCCFCKPLSSNPSHCISRWTPKFCHVNTLFDPEFCTRGFSYSYQWYRHAFWWVSERRQWSRTTEDGFVCLGLKDSVFLLLKYLSHPPISVGPAVFCFLRHLGIVHSLTHQCHF